MTRYYLRLRALSPLSITGHQNLAGQASTTLTYIPGHTLRGALAWKLLRENPKVEETPAFRLMFAGDGLRCGPLYPLGQPGSGKGAAILADLSLPLPLTARTCKRHPGFRLEPDVNARGHGVVDTLVAALEETIAGRLHEKGQTPPAELAGLQGCERCRQEGCGAALDRLTGYYQHGEGDDGPWFREARPRRSLVTRTALLPEMESASLGKLFAREVLEADQEFAGLLEISSGLEDLLTQIAAQGGEIEVGAGRTVGLGRMMVMELTPDPGRKITERRLGTIEQRQQTFKACLPEALQKRWAFAPITMLSDTILLDAQLRYASAPEPDILRHYAALDGMIQKLPGGAQDQPPACWPGDTKLLLAVMRLQRSAGWHTGKDARPRTNDLAIAAGSAFVLIAPLEQEAALLSAARWLETHGLGERRAEGFGQVAVAHPFHAERGLL
jgi:CRISPR-associated Csx10 family RAMP protein